MDEHVSEKQGVPRVLLVSDRPGSEPAWEHILRQEGLIALLESPGAKALKRWSTEEFSVVVVDAGKTWRGRVRLGRMIRERSDTPIILCLQDNIEEHILEAYAAGMQDVVTRPLKPAVLLAKILAWARHDGSGRKMEKGQVKAGGYYLNPNRRCLVDPRGREIPLTSLEFRLLQLLMSQPGRIFKVEEIVRSLWGIHGHNDHVSLKNVVYRLRRKIEADPRRPDLVHTWPEGYSFPG